MWAIDRCPYWRRAASNHIRTNAFDLFQCGSKGPVGLVGDISALWNARLTCSSMLISHSCELLILIAPYWTNWHSTRERMILIIQPTSGQITTSACGTHI